MKYVRVIVSLTVIAFGSLSTVTADIQATTTPLRFQLRSHQGREWTQADFDDKELVVVAFLGTECPLVKLYGPRLQSLQEEFSDRLAVIGINSNTQDSLTEMKAYAERSGVTFPLLKDLNNKVADQFDAKRTPEVFLLDKDRQVRYHGRVDDQYDVGITRDEADRHDLRVAIEELLAGKEVSVPKTEVVGCHIGRVRETEPTGTVTYTKHIAKIINSRCVECHRDGELAPFTLTSYEDLMGWEDTICEVIEENRMPPWFANPEHGTFHNDARLSKEEKELIYQWVENGMPEGDPADLPTPPTFTKGWRIPKPDQVFKMDDKPFTVKAQGTIDYKHFMVDPGWDEDKYISAAEARPDNKSVVHHILVYILPPGERRRRDTRLDKILVGYAPGSMPVMLDEGVALKVEAGSKLLFQMHYTPNGYEQQDQSYAGVKFIDKKDVKTLARGRVAINTDFRIPPNASDHVVKSDYHVSRDEMLVAMTPHMHLRGKSFRYEAVYPDGDKEILLDVPNYDFNWQLKYILKEPKLLPKGTTILCTASYDNSEQNPVNPDPSDRVSWGDQSWQEMMIGFFDTIPPDVDAQSTVLKSNPSIDPTGVYYWTGRMGGELSLAMADDVLTGKLKTMGEDVPIEDAVIEGDKISFTASAEKLGGIMFDFDATVSDDAIRGKVFFNIAAFGRRSEVVWTAHKKEDQ